MRDQLLSVFFILAAGAFFFAGAQTAETLKPSVVMGDVTSLGSGKIVVQAKDGPVEVTLNEKTEFKRVPPDNPSLKAAVPAALSDIAVGDKLVVSGIYPPDRKTLPARTVYLMTKSDISQKEAKESEKWRTRGITGRVVSVDPVAKKVSVEMRSLMGSSTLSLLPAANAKILRYAKDSVKYSEAVPGTLLDIQPGDMVRALGDRSADGASFTAEEIITGAFQTVAGTVKSVNAASNEVVITNAQTNKDVTISLASATLLKRFPEEMAQRMAQFQNGGAQPPAGQTGPPRGERPQGGAPGGQGRGMGARGGIDDMLDRFPNITAADLKAGDVIAVSSTKNSDQDRINAIKLLAGVEPFLRAAQASGGSGGRGRGNQTGSFTIPGLDGFDGP